MSDATAKASSSSSTQKDVEDERQYALVSCSPPVSVFARESSPESLCHSSMQMIRHEMLELYESFAESSPNAALQQENNDRDRLLRALSAADHAVQLNPTRKRTSWFSFGRKRKQPNDTSETATTTTDSDSEDARLIFTDLVDEAPDQSWLLGTEFSLDAACVPSEAHSVARWHLLCRTSKCPNVARTSWEIAGTSGIVVTGLGSLVEFKPNRKQQTADVRGGSHTTTSPTSPNDATAITQQYTSDRQNLLSFAAERHKPWHASCTRAAVIGPNLLVISWGIPDDNGTIVLYRRRVPTTAAVATVTVETNGSSPPATLVAWEAVAYIAPSQTVHECFVDVFDDVGSGSALMGVTDLVPLVVELNNSAPAVTLAVARLGGFVELVPLPPQIWYGPELPAPKSRGGTAVGSRRRPGEHYAIGKLVNVTSAPASGVVCFATSDYHGDILGLEVFRTCVDANASIEWNQEAYPDGPPAEHVLAAHGTEANSGQQCVSFWSVSTILSAQANVAGPGFSIHAALVDALNLGKTGPDMTLFCTPKILRYWRKPRRVELSDTTNSTEQQSSIKMDRVTTISVSAPIVGLRFIVSEGTGVRAAVLDWNGGVCLLDCTLLEKSASHILSSDEYVRLNQNRSEDETPVSCIQLVANRSQMTKSFFADFNPITSSARLSSLEWFRKPNAGPLSLAALTRDPCTLRLTRVGSRSSSASTTQCVKLGVGTFLQFAGRNKPLYLVFQSPTATPEESLSINFCLLQELSAGDIVSSLIRSTKYREAVEAAEKLTPVELDSVAVAVEDCKRRLWESELDFSMLRSLKDDAYVVHEALYLFPRASSPRIQVAQNGDVPLFRSVCRLALMRIRSARLGASLSFATGVGAVKEIVNDIQSRLINLGTYELLCRYLECTPSLDQFFHSYLAVTASELALHFAQTAALAPLSILLYRHQHELAAMRFEILNIIPLSTSPRSYQHLLPVGSAQRFTKFMATPNGRNYFDMSDMDDYLNVRFKVQSTVDIDDKTLIDKFYALPWHDDVTSVDVAQWYSNRALAIHRFISNLAYTSYFTRLALCGLGLEHDAQPETYSDRPPSTEKIYRLFRFTETVLSLQANGNEVKLLSTLSSLDADTFAAMDTKDLVGLVLNCKGDSVDLFARYSSYLVPLMRERLSTDNDESLFSKMDTAIQLFCLSLVKTCGQGERMLSSEVLDAVNVCSKICWSSRTSIAKCNRVIKEKSVLVALVLSLADEIAILCSAVPLKPQDQRCILNYIWKMYEAIPSQAPPDEVNDCELSSSLLLADNLFRKLVVVDMVLRWSGDNAIVLLHGNVLTLPEGENIVYLLCASFLDQLVDSEEGDVESRHRKNVTLLSSLFDDIKELNAVSFHGHLSLGLLFVRNLFTSLLHRGEFQLIGELCLRTQPDGLDTDLATTTILSFINDCVDRSAIETDSGRGVRSATECQDVLGQWFPEINKTFKVIRQHLDVSHYINTVLLQGVRESLSPEQVRTMFPMDVVEYVLERNPKSILKFTEEWVDPEWAKQTNEKIRVASDTSTSKLLPAQAIFHLAQLLHLNEIGAVIVVKSRVVHHALLSKLHGVAAAVCRTLAVDRMAANMDYSPVLDAVTKTVSYQEYKDDETKQELCSLMLAMNLGKLSIQKMDQLSTIRSVWEHIESRNRFLVNVSGCKLSSVSALFLATRNEYATELSELFVTLQRQVIDCVADDALLVALARYAVFWCIGRSTQSGTEPTRSLEAVSTVAIIELSASLLLSIHEGTVAKECGSQLGTVFRQQLAAMNRTLDSSTSRWERPDADIVQALVGRGYSECGARRAAAMTENRGIAEALQWSVMHSLDASFNEPLAVIKSSRLFHDSQSATALELTLSVVEKIIVDGVPLSAVLKTSSNAVSHRAAELRREKSIPPKASIGHVDFAVSNGSHASSAATSASRVKKLKTAPSTLSVKSDLPTTTATAVNGTPSNNNRFRAPVAVPLIAPTSKLEVPSTMKLGRSVATIPSLSNTTGLTVEIPIDTSIAQTLDEHSPSRGSVMTTSSTRSNADGLAVPSPDRSTLLQAGQAAFQTARSTSSPSVSERKRLMEEGRLLLLRTRSTPRNAGLHSSVAVLTTTTTAPIGTSSTEAPQRHTMIPAVAVAETIVDDRKASSRMVQKLDADADNWDFDEDDLDM